MNRTDLDEVSLRTLAQQAPNHLCWIVFSVFGILTNLAVLITIAKTKSLHNKSQMVIFSYSFVEVLYMAAYFGTGLARYSAFVLSQPQTSDQMSCALRQMPLMLTGVLMRLFSVALALDRFLCLALPIVYKNLSAKKYALLVNSSIWLYSVTGACIGFVSLDRSTSLIAVCNFKIIYNHEYDSYWRIQDQIFVSLAAALYFTSSCILYYRYKKAALIGLSQLSDWKRQMNFDVFVQISVIGLIYLACSGCSSCLTWLAGRSSLETAIVLTPIVSMCSFVSAISHVFVYLKLNKRFREGFCRSFRCKKPVVQPVS